MHLTYFFINTVKKLNIVNMWVVGKKITKILSTYEGRKILEKKIEKPRKDVLLVIRYENHENSDKLFIYTLVVYSKFLL